MAYHRANNMLTSWCTATILFSPIPFFAVDTAAVNTVFLLALIEFVAAQQRCEDKTQAYFIQSVVGKSVGNVHQSNTEAGKGFYHR